MTEQEYVKKTAKYLKCSPRKKREIVRQLMSDIEIALGEGRQLEEVLAEMGEPRALAGEFNENLDRNEKRKAKRRKRKIVLAAVLLVLAAAAGVAYWILPRTREIEDSSVFEKETLRSRSEHVIALFNAEDYEGLRECADEKMRDLLTKEVLDDAKRQIPGEWGEYRATGNVYMAEISQMGMRFALVQVNVSYDNSSVTFTLLFDRDMKLSGFYVK